MYRYTYLLICNLLVRGIFGVCVCWAKTRVFTTTSDFSSPSLLLHTRTSQPPSLFSSIPNLSWHTSSIFSSFFNPPAQPQAVHAAICAWHTCGYDVATAIIPKSTKMDGLPPYCGPFLHVSLWRYTFQPTSLQYHRFNKIYHHIHQIRSVYSTGNCTLIYSWEIQLFTVLSLSQQKNLASCLAVSPDLSVPSSALTFWPAPIIL